VAAPRRAIPAVVVDRVGPEVEVEAVPRIPDVAAAAAVVAASLPATAVTDADRAGPKAGDKAAPRTPDAVGEAVVEVSHSVVPALVADKAGQEVRAGVAAKTRAVEPAEVAVAVEPAP